MYRVTTLFTGPLVTGGGISQLYFDEAGGTAAEAQSAVATFWEGVAGVMSDEVDIEVVSDVETVSVSTGQVTGITPTETVNLVGLSTGDPLPLSTQGLIRWRTGFYAGGREVRGRTFIPGMTESNSTDGKPTTGLPGSLTGVAQSLVNDASSELVVYSRSKAASAAVVSATCWDNWAVLRSRRD